MLSYMAKQTAEVTELWVLLWENYPGLYKQEQCYHRGSLRKKAESEKEKGVEMVES